MTKAGDDATGATEALIEEVRRYAASLSYAQAVAMKSPVAEQRGTATPDNEDFYQASVRLLEAVHSERENYAHVTVSVDDGRVETAFRSL